MVKSNADKLAAAEKKTKAKKKHADQEVQDMMEETRAEVEGLQRAAEPDGEAEEVRVSQQTAKKRKET